MNPSLAVLFDGRNYLWDGQPCATAEEAARVAAQYERDRFEARILEQDGTFLVYTRRKVTESAAPAP